MRFRVSISFKGTNYCGWQAQPNALAIQEVIEQKLGLILHEKIAIVGCGRTDAGVHARNYIFHFDTQNDLPQNFKFKLNQFLPIDIAVHTVEQCSDDFHARFDAVERSYIYSVHQDKQVFDNDQSFHFHRMGELDMDEMNKACELLLNTNEFAPFCKTNSDAKTMICELSNCQWLNIKGENRIEFHISANRFLRGMVRLIVGMMLHVGIGKINLQTLSNTLKEQSLLTHSWSVPAHGLFFEEVKY